MKTYSIRPEQVGDEAAIHDLVKRAFAPMPFSDGDEQELVDALRAAGDLIHSRVAVDPDGVVIGHIAFSPVTIAGQSCGWFQMAPVSVTPEFQRRGIGSALIKTGIELMRQSGAQGIGVVGNPAYYERFGFAVVPNLGPDGPDAIYFRAIVLKGPTPAGVVRYAAAFG